MQQLQQNRGAHRERGGAPKQVEWLEHYRPSRRWYRSGHIQTIVGNFLRRKHDLPEADTEIIEVEPARDGLPASHVLCHCHWQPPDVRAQRLTVLLLHGLEGSSSSHYVLGNADKAWRAGCNVIRMNMRSCGGTDNLAPTVYHCGLSQDVGKVIDHCIRRYGLERIALVGYSMGGNLVLKYAGETAANIPGQVKAVVGVSPATDLALCSAALHEWQNRPYEWNFLRGLLQHYRAKAKLYPDVYDVKVADKVHNLREFDNFVVARYSGFADADDYYRTTGAGRFVQDITVPTLIIHALDDPFIRMSAETREKLRANPHVTLVETQHGGHCAFLAYPAGNETVPAADAYWAERTLLRFLLNMTPMENSGESSVMDAADANVQ